jgi:serine/threonine protein kinase/Flp pilus assembly protein TadD
MDEAAILARFLDLYRADLDGAGVRPLHDYQSRFPGYEHVIAREYAELAEAPEPSASPSAVPAWVGPFRIVEALARGGQGDVYLAEDRRLRRRVAVKVLHGSGVFREQALLRFRREAEVTARLDHPGICPVYEVGTAGGVAYIAMKHVPGRSLAAQLAHARTAGATTADGPARRRDAVVGAGTTPLLPGRGRIDAIVALVRQVALALHAAHEHGIIHRDVKPGNVMVTPAGDAVLVDFGFASEEDSTQSLTRSGDLFGTPAYMSPEQLERRALRIDRRTDVWSLGVTLYEALTLERPFCAPTREGLHRAILTEPPRDPRRVNPAVGRDLRIVLDTALAKDRDRRYQTAAAFADDLQAVLDGRPIAAKPAGPWTRLTRWAAREPARAGLVATIAVALPAIAALVALRIADRPRVEAQRRAERQALHEHHLLEAQRRHEESDHDGAVRDFTAAIAAGDGVDDEGVIEAVIGIALIHAGAHRFAEALQVLDEHADRLGERRGVVWLRNGVHRRLGRYGPDQPLPPLRDALDHYLEGQQLLEEAKGGAEHAPTRAKEAFLQAILQSTAPRLPRYTWAIDAAIQAADPVLIAAFERALARLWPRSALAHHWRGLGLQALGDEAAALAAHQRAIEVQPDYARAHFSVGCHFGNAGDLDAAITSLREAVRLEPDYAPARDALGRVYRDAKRLDDAVEQFEAAVALERDNGRAHRRLASALLAQGQRERATAVYRRAAELADRTDAEGLYDLAIELTAVGLTAEAIAAYEQAVLARPDFADAHGNLGLLLANSGNLEAALTAQRRAVQLDQDDVPSLVNLADVLVRMDRCTEAIEVAAKAVALDEQFAEAHCNLGWARRGAGLFAPALEAMRRGHALGTARERWQYDSAGWVRELEQLVEAEQRMLAVAAGTAQPRDDVDRVGLADLAAWTGRWELAAGWFAAVLQRRPELLDRRGDLAVRAARSMVQAAAAAAAGEPRAGALPPAAMRAQALAWLRHELGKRVGEPAEQRRPLLAAWSTDPELAPVREPALASLPADEHAAWHALWADVAAATR